MFIKADIARYYDFYNNVYFGETLNNDLLTAKDSIQSMPDKFFDWSKKYSNDE